MEFSADDIISACRATLLNKGSGARGVGMSTDTRTLKQNELFVALQGPNFDGSDFCDAAIKQGAWGILVDHTSVREHERTRARTWVFQVPDTLHALGDLATWWRKQMPAKRVAITGSNGKTTTKEMLASIVATRFKTLKTEGNFNNLIGLPLTINRWTREDQVAIFEMGMNAPGEIRRLTEIADPEVGIITNAAAAHLEKLHTVEKVAQAKAELFETMQSDGTAVFNQEDPWIAPLGEKYRGRKISFGMQKNATVRFEHMESEGFDRMDLKFAIGKEKLKVSCHTSGLHNVMNAMAAAAGATALGMTPEEIIQGLEKFRPLAMRFEQVQLGNGVRLVNDTYNANPMSMEAAFRTVGAAKRAGRFVAVLGDMKELGEASDALHQAVGKKAAESGVEKLFVIGEFSAQLLLGAKKAGLNGSSVSQFDNADDLVKQLGLALQAGDVVLVKGSRAMKLEKIVEALKIKFGA